MKFFKHVAICICGFAYGEELSNLTLSRGIRDSAVIVPAPIGLCHNTACCRSLRRFLRERLLTQLHISPV